MDETELIDMFQNDVTFNNVVNRIACEKNISCDEVMSKHTEKVLYLTVKIKNQQINTIEKELKKIQNDFQKKLYPIFLKYEKNEGIK